MENNNFISNNPFEFNIQLPKKTLSEVQKVVQKEVADISINPIMDYLDKNNKVWYNKEKLGKKLWELVEKVYKIKFK